MFSLFVISPCLSVSYTNDENGFLTFSMIFSTLCSISQPKSSKSVSSNVLILPFGNVICIIKLFPLMCGSYINFLRYYGLHFLLFTVSIVVIFFHRKNIKNLPHLQRNRVKLLYMAQIASLNNPCLPVTNYFLRRCSCGR